MANVYGTSRREEAKASRIAAVNVSKRRYQKAYLDYWNSTAKLTGTGRPIDGLIAPVAPFPAARPQRYRYYGYTIFVNLLDYPSVAFPVTVVDKAVDNKEVETIDDGAEGDLAKLRSEMAADCESRYFFLSSTFHQLSPD